MKTFVIVNATASAGRARRMWIQLKDQLAAIRSFDSAYTQRAGHAMELARDASVAGYELVVAFGGDGTVHETANGIMRGDASRTVLGIIPAGSGNDIARTLGIPATPSQASELLREPRTRPMDLIRVGDRYCVGAGGVGFDGEVAALANRWPKYLPGPLTYVLGIVVTLATFNPVDLELELDGVMHRPRAFTAAVGNTQYYGSGMRICPLAETDDGLVDVVIVGALSKIEVLRMVPSLFKGLHVLHPKVTSHKAREVVVRSKVPLSIQIDGELVGKIPATFTNVPGALRVVAGTPLAPMDLKVAGDAVHRSG
ncbi:MAG TPA: sphingosine kinase [Clostridiales bacterium]|nr:sphingosine kinase [Clostridiales bacterium]